MIVCKYLIEFKLVALAVLSFSIPILCVSPQPKLYSIITSHDPSLSSQKNPSEDLSHNETTSHQLDFHEPVPHILSINEGSSIDVMINTQSAITVNLNQAVPEDVSVTIQVYSGTSLIRFGSVTGNNTANLTITYKANSFGDRVVPFFSKDIAGHTEIVCRIEKQPKDVTIDDSSAYISLNISKSDQLSILISIVGWIYFAAWSLSFYFQVILNYQRKSVVGLNFDFLALNLLGFTCYTIYNFTLMFSRDVQKDYYTRNAYSRIPVEYNDLFFALHAFVLTLITIIQCFIYERGEQRVSFSAGVFVGLSSVVGSILYVIYLFNQLAILDVVLYLSYVKLAITIIKYIPQAYMNYARKATSGWSIHNILLDFTGGLFSLVQMFLIAYNYDDWISIFGNFTKFGLGVISIAFDLLFVTQHYILYNQIGQLDVSTDSVPSPVISESVRSIRYSRQQGEGNNTKDDDSDQSEQP